MARTVLEVVVAGDSKSLERAMSRSSKATEKFGRDAEKSTKRASSGIRGIGTAAKVAGGALAGGALVAGLRDVANAAIESEKSSVRLQAQLRASGISYKQYGDRIEEVIQKQSRLAALDDEDLQDAFTSIVRNTGSVEKSLKLMGLASDLARGKQIDVAKAGEIVAKVAGGNTGILSRYGIQIEKGATATQALGVLQRRFAGQAEAYGKSNAGAFDRFSVASENLKERLGSALLPSLARVADGLAKFVTQAESGTGAGGKFAAVVGSMVNAVKRVVSAVAGMVRGFREGDATMVALGTTAAALVAGFTAFKVITTVIAAMKALRVAVIAVNVAMRANPFVLVATAVAALGAALVVAYKKSETFRNVVNGVFRAVRSVVTGVISFMIRRFDDLLGAMSSFLSFAGKIPGVGSKFRGLADQIDRGREKLRSMADRIDAINKKPVKPRVVLTDIDRAIRRAGSLKDALLDSDIKLTPRPQGDGIGRTPGRSSGSLKGANSALMPLARVGFANGLQVSSGKRAAGGRTSSGGISYHGSGEAVDLFGPPAGMMRTFRALRSRFGSRLAELIYTPGGTGIKNGRPHRYSGSVAADHFDHVHVALDLGAPGPGLGSFGGNRSGDGYGAGDLKGLAKGQGLSESEASIAAAVALAESGGNPRAVNRNSNGSVDRGLWQINSVHGSLSTFDVGGNARAMAKISRGGSNWRPWVAYNTGAYKRFMSAARSAGSSSRASAGKIGVGSVRKGSGSAGGGFLSGLVNAQKITDGSSFTPGPAKPLIGPGGAPVISPDLGAPTGVSVAQFLRDQKYDSANAAVALAALTGGTADDLAALQNLAGITSADLEAAKARGDNKQIIELAGALKGLNDQIASLNANVEQNTQALLDLERQQRQQAEDRARLATSQYGVLANALADVVNGNLGGRVGLGYQTPGFAGGGVRY